MTDEIKRLIFESEPFHELSRRAAALEPGGTAAFCGAAGSLLACASAALAASRDGQLLVVTAEEDRAEQLRDDCALLLGEGNIRYFGTRPAHQAQALDMSSPIAQIETLKALVAGGKLLVVASAQAIAQKLPPPASFRNRVVELRVKEEHPFEKLLRQLEEVGFERKSFVETYGDFAVRGGILDVFPFVGENPVRIEFWGNRIESIREFDPLSQRSIRELEAASIVPELAAGVGGADAAAHPIFDYLGSDALLLLDGRDSIERGLGDLPVNDAFFTADDLLPSLRGFPVVRHEALASGHAGVVDVGASPQPAFNGSVNALLSRVGQLRDNGYRIILASDTDEESKRLRELMEDVPAAESAGEEDDASPARLLPEFASETLHSGFIFPAVRLALFTEHEVFNRQRRRGLPKRRRFRGFSKKELQQLRRGDYVVHVDHGIGTFAGLAKIKVGGVEQEAMRLRFLEDDTLYVNLSFINRVQKFSSQEGHTPKLSKLGTGEWDKMKARAKKRIKDIARDIIAVYARRKMEPGFAFSHDTHWQKELEASFMYEDTPDQAQATLDVKADMEQPSPMDRLICGDVGFGKTEVAVRAAFKAVMDGKQVALLVPTTILAIQHFHTFQDRLARYTARIEQITRFRSAKEQKAIVAAVKEGGVDILIGTHRLLSKDVAFKDLGLLIVDEEHRFGVTAKERLRSLRASVDTLALTATPIPRTLHFSLIGARDLSLINTPPRNRLPILTDIVPGDGRARQWDSVREAVVRELHRGGQIYVVHDRVQNIEAVANEIRARVPQARVHIAHGQMSGHDLEKTMVDFLEKKYDVLVCTKIIESGVDIPSVNTIIVNRADRFGLAELYQLRGRVGRSNVQAYALLLTPPLSSIPKQTLRRLQAIEEFTELGSGFNLAMRDLEIRGAGNLLGAEQSGFIMEMGFEMYERIVREAVEELRREEFGGTKGSEGSMVEGAAVPPSGGIETLIDADVEALIPGVYVESDTERLDLYRRLYRAASEEEIIGFAQELKDRFGDYPEEVGHLIRLVMVRLAASRLRLPKISLSGTQLVLTLPPETDEAFYGTSDDENSPFARLMKILTSPGGGGMRLKQEGSALTLRMKAAGDGDAAGRLASVRDRLISLRNEIAPSDGGH